jgi:hypothetical protein
MSHRPCDEEILIPFNVIEYKVPRKYLLNRYYAQKLITGDRAKLSKIKYEAEKIILKANHVISIVDSTTIRAMQQDRI